MRKLFIVMCTGILAACSSPPKPPQVSGNSRIPINDAHTVEVLSLRAKAWDGIQETSEKGQSAKGGNEYTTD